MLSAPPMLRMPLHCRQQRLPALLAPPLHTTLITEQTAIAHPPAILAETNRSSRIAFVQLLQLTLNVLQYEAIVRVDEEVG